MILRSLAACTLLFFAACSHPPDDPETAARRFLRAVTAGHLSEAYSSTTFSFRALQSEGAFSASAQEIGLIGATIDSVQVVSQAGTSAKVKAVMDTAKGAEPFTLALQQEEGEWRVLSVKSPPNPQTGMSANHFAAFGRSLAFSDTSSQPPPDDRTVSHLLRESMIDFAKAISERSFVEFYGKVSKAWQAQLTERQLEKAFQNFIDQDVNLTGVTETNPVFDAPPMISAEGLLLVSGHYPTKPYEVVYLFKYAYEEQDWKLFGLDLNLRPAPVPATPAPK